MEKFFYEVRPFFYLAVAAYAVLWHPGHLLMHICGGLLFVSSFFIFSWRAKHRGYLG